MLEKVQRGGVERKVQIGISSDQIDKDCRVYLFYFEGSAPNLDLMTALKNLGDRTGQNLDIITIKEDDEHYFYWIKKFNINKLPAIVITGSEAVASFGEGNDERTAYVKLDREGVLADIPATMDYLQETYNLFLIGDVKQALDEVRPALDHIKFSHFLQKSGQITKKFFNFVESHKIDVSIGPFKIDLEQADDKIKME